MFFFLSKTISYLLTPFGWLLATLLLALFTKKPARRRWWLITSLVLLWVLGSPFLVNLGLRAWERPPATWPLADTSARVAVVLTGGITNSGRTVQPERPLLSGQADRAMQALWLYKTGRVRHILISGGQPRLRYVLKESVTDESRQTARFLQLAGVPASAIWMEPKSVNTYENARFSAQVLRSKFKTNRCIVVTSALHSRRAEACFQKQGLIVTAFPGNFQAEPVSWIPTEFLPREESMQDSYGLIREIVGYVSYVVAGYV